MAADNLMSFHMFEILYPRSRSGVPKSRRRYAEHARIGIVEFFLRLSNSTNYRSLMFSKLLTRGFSFQFYFLLWEFNNAFSHF